MKQSENMVLEAMAHLSAVHDALEDMLMGGSGLGSDPRGDPPGGAPPASGAGTS